MQTLQNQSHKTVEKNKVEDLINATDEMLEALESQTEAVQELKKSLDAYVEHLKEMEKEL